MNWLSASLLISVAAFAPACGASGGAEQVPDAVALDARIADAGLVDAAGVVDAATADSLVGADAPAEPVTRLLTAPPTRTRDLSATFTFAGGDSYRCRLDGEAPSPCQSPYTRGVAEGVHVFEVAAASVTGTFDLTPERFAWEVDRTGPTVVLEGPAEGATTGGIVTFRMTSEAGARLVCGLDAPPQLECPASETTLPQLSGGPHNFAVQAFDALGNAGPVAVRNFVVDATGPTVTVTPFPAHLTPAAGTVVYAASPPAAKYECRLDGAAFAPCGAAGFSFSGLTTGPHTFAIRATDEHDNTGGETEYAFAVLGTATITVEYRGVPVPGAAVVSHASDGAAVAVAITDAGGVATASTAPGGMVSAVLAAHTVEPFSLGFTVSAVAEGENLTVGFPGAPRRGAIDVTAPAGTGCQRYVVDIGGGALTRGPEVPDSFCMFPRSGTFDSTRAR